jgi:hypothetical protein
MNGNDDFSQEKWYTRNMKKGCSGFDSLNDYWFYFVTMICPVVSGWNTVL